MKTIAFINQKGGVGKSTAAIAVAEALTIDHSCKVLLIDLDPQCNLTYSFGASVKGLTSKSLLDGGTNTLEAVQKRPQGDVIPSNPKLSGADADYMMEIAKEHLLEDALKKLTDYYDFCILDTPPALGTVTINALTAA
ncbi:MAG: AAA family ATPase, partial [Burkholderiales bacterium]|nr:AAA family ATPase [Burkholderiales bacterium]